MKSRFPTRLAATLVTVVLAACGGSDEPEQHFDRVPPTLGETRVWRVSFTFNGGTPAVWSIEERVVLITADGYRIDATMDGQLVVRDEFDQGDLLLRSGPAVYDTNGELDYVATCSYSYDPSLVLYPRSVGQSWTTRRRTTECYDGWEPDLDVTVVVEAIEVVTVPAGTFEALRIVRRERATDYSQSVVETCWWAIVPGRDVRCDMTLVTGSTTQQLHSELTAFGG